MVLSMFYNLVFGSSSSKTMEDESETEPKIDVVSVDEEPVFIEDTRQCTACLKDLPISQFQVRRRKRRSLRRSKCKECVASSKAFDDHRRKLSQDDIQ